MLKSLFSFLKRIDSIYSAILYRKSISSEGLPPHGGSGLKWEKHTAGSCRWWSPSTRREWIEIAQLIFSDLSTPVSLHMEGVD